MAESNDLPLLYGWWSDGSLITNFPKQFLNVEFGSSRTFLQTNVPVLTDLDRNGRLDLLVTNSGFLYVFEFSAGEASGPFDWPMFAHDERHTGAYTVTTRLVEPIVIFPGWNRVELGQELVDGFSGKSLLEELGRVCGNVKFEAIGAVENEKWSEYVSQFGGEDFQLSVNMDYWLKTDGYCLSE